MLLERQIYNFRNLAHQYDNGVVDQHLFQSTLAVFRGLLSTPGGAAYWSENSSTFTTAARKYLQDAA